MKTGVADGDSAFHDDYWVVRGNGKLLSYIGPKLSSSLETEAVRGFLRRRRALGATWEYDHDEVEQGPWYRCICDNENYDLSEIKSQNVRHNLRRGLRRCSVRPIEYEWLSEHGYEVYSHAASRYVNFNVESRKRYREQLLSLAHSNRREAWGVFVGNSIVAYMTTIVHSGGVFADTAHFDPAHASAYPMVVLYYSAARHYLRERGLGEFSRGTRPLLHETKVDEFLTRLGFRISYCRLGLYLDRRVSIALPLARRLRGIAKIVLPSGSVAMVEGLLLAQDVAGEATKASPREKSPSLPI